MTELIVLSHYQATPLPPARQARRPRVVTPLDLGRTTALDIARLNPWSRELFDNPQITLLVGDAFELIRTLGDGTFARIVHDPPTFSLAGELYAEEFYREACRVLASGGRMFHYIGDPASKFGRRMTRGVVERLQAAGFRRVVPQAEAFGVLAYN